MVLRTPPERCTNCESNNIRQEEDVLDTWFSSWLWPFSTQGWPEKTKDLDYFYPTDLLVTGPDIIFFWVARMIMAGLEFVGKVPFRDVLLNGIVRDEFGRKMSKSLGNGIDPLEMIEKYSADAVRFTLIIMSSEGQDINLSVNHFEMGRNFSNKIWNAFRFISMHVEEIDTDYRKYRKNFDLADRWILSVFQKTIKQVSENLDRYKINDSLNTLYQFFWHDYCDWYLELIKKRLYQKTDLTERKTALSIAIHIMKETMNLLHPYMPFISEEIWQSFKIKDDQSVVISSWPEVKDEYIDEEAEADIAFLQDAISAVRNIRAEMNVPPGKTAQLFFRSSNGKNELLTRYKIYFESMSKINEITQYTKEDLPVATATAVIHGVELLLPLEGLIDIEKEKARLNKEIMRLEEQEKGIRTKLANKNFLKKAPEKVVTIEKEKLQKIENNLAKVKENYYNLIEH